MKKAIRHLFYIGLSAQLLSACNSTSDPAKYLKAIQEDKAVNKTVSIGNIEYKFKIVTPQAMALKAAEQEGHIDKAVYESRLKDLKGNLFLNIDMELTDHSGPVLKYQLKSQGDYEQRVMYYEFYAKDDLKISCDGEPVPIKSYEYENRQGLSPYNTMVLVFPVDKLQDHLQVTFNDRAFNNLFIKADFKKSDINHLPSFTLN